MTGKVPQYDLEINKEIKPHSSPKLQQTKQVVIKKDQFVRKWDHSLANSYIIDKKLGEGSFGQVFLVTHKQLKIKRALKIINKSKKSSSNPIDQLQLLKKLDHPNILRIYQYFQSPQKWYLITEYFQGNELFDEIVANGNLSEKIAVQIISEIIKALIYIHSNGIAHRDIKAENILVRNNGGEYIIKVIDWGLGVLTNGQNLIRRCGTPQYCAPQVLSGKYSMACDMWSLGVLTYIMLSGYMPFKGQSVKDTLLLVKKGNVTFKYQIWQQVSESAKLFVLALLQKNEGKRLKASQCLSHSWINQNQLNVQKQVNLQNTLMRLKEFHTQNKFQIVVINFILNFIQSPKQQQRLKRQFDMLDINNDGSISYQELLQAYRKIYGAEADLIVEQIFTNIDLDCSKSITFSQFITFASQINQNFNQQQLREAFRLFDYDNDGLIDKKQINNLIAYEKGSKSSQEFDQVIGEIDLNNDGKIDLEQFIQHINSAVERVKTKTSSLVKQQNKSNPNSSAKKQKSEDNEQ